jgi:hypothetical protein
MSAQLSSQLGTAQLGAACLGDVLDLADRCEPHGRVACNVCRRALRRAGSDSIQSLNPAGSIAAGDDGGLPAAAGVEHSGTWAVYHPPVVCHPHGRAGCNVCRRAARRSEE